MSEIHGGWEIVCPDGAVRHFPYSNHGDAEHDAGIFAERGCKPDEYFPRTAECKGGIHTVRPCVFVPPAERGEA